MKVGIASPLLRASVLRSGGPYTGRLIEIEQCAAEVEQRAEHEIRETERDSLAGVALDAEQQAERLLGEPDDDDERSERPERVRVVSGPEQTAADERSPP
jgi:hypothetical protein